MTELLKKKYSTDFQSKARKLADSLDLTPNWYKPTADYNGDTKELVSQLESKLKTSKLNLDNDSRFFIQITIDTTGIPKNPLILKGGINETTDKKILDLVYANIQPTNWTPAYLHGRPVKSNFVFRLQMKEE